MSGLRYGRSPQNKGKPPERTRFPQGEPKQNAEVDQKKLPKANEGGTALPSVVRG